MTRHPDRSRPPAGNDERRIGQEKKLFFQTDFFKKYAYFHLQLFGKFVDALTQRHWALNGWVSKWKSKFVLRTAIKPWKRKICMHTNNSPCLSLSLIRLIFFFCIAVFYSDIGGDEIWQTNSSLALYAFISVVKQFKLNIVIKGKKHSFVNISFESC